LLADKDNEKRVVKEIQSKLIVKDEYGENMLVSQFDANML
jgi:hypothetical protein